MIINRLLFVVSFVSLAATFAGCGGSKNSTLDPQPAVPTSAPPTPINPSTPAMLRAVHGSPDAGNVDIYIYPAGSARPSAPTLANVPYLTISTYASVAGGTPLTIAVLAAGKQTVDKTETVTLSPGSMTSAVVAGTVANNTLQFVNFGEPVETMGTSALSVHHASPAAAVLANPIGIGYYDSHAVPMPANTDTSSLFQFSFTPGTNPAVSDSGTGTVRGGSYLVTPIPPPIPSTPPALVGFAAGAPGPLLNPLGSVAVFESLPQIGFATSTNPGQAMLAKSDGSFLASGGHLTIFAIDAPGNSAAFTGTIDP